MFNLFKTKKVITGDRLATAHENFNYRNGIPLDYNKFRTRQELFARGERRKRK